MHDEDFGRLLMVLFFLAVGIIFFSPKLFSMIVFYALPAVVFSALAGQILAAIAREKPHESDYEYSALLPYFAVLGAVSWGLLLKFGSRTLNSKGQVLFTPIDDTLYSLYNGFASIIHLFSIQNIFRGLEYQKELYDTASLTWVFTFALMIGTPIATLMIIHFGGGRLRPSKSRLGIKISELEKEGHEIDRQLFAEKNHTKSLTEKLEKARSELQRLKEDRSAFSDASQGMVSRDTKDDELPDSDTF